jgi:WD40 repeat protein
VPRYHAFISYSHEPDAKIAATLRLALHKFAKPWYKQRAVSVFLDQSSLSANPALWPAIEAALSSADHLLLLASERSAASFWVRKEIDWWLRNRSADKMLVLLTSGEVHWDQAARDFDWKKTTAIAPELAGRFADEPLYVDLRWARNESNLNLSHARFRAAVLDVAAPLNGRSKDELDGEDVRQNRRTLRVARSVALVLVLLTAAAVWQAVVANQQRREAEWQRDIADKQTAEAQRQRAEAETQRQRAVEQEGVAKEQRDEAVRQRDLAVARSLVAESNRLSANDYNWNLAMLLAIESMRSSPTAEAYEALARLASGGARAVARFPGRNAAAFSPDGFQIATQEGEGIAVREARGGKLLARISLPGEGPVRSLCFTPGGGRILSRQEDRETLIDWKRQNVVAWPGGMDGATVRAVSGNCRYLASGSSIVDFDSGSTRIASLPGSRLLAVSDDGQRIAFTDGSRGRLVDAVTGATVANFIAPSEVERIDFAANGQTVLVRLKDGGLRVLRSSGLEASPARGIPSRTAEVSAERAGRELVLWNRRSGAWVKRLPLREASGPVTWSELGEFLLYQDQGVRILGAESWRPLGRLLPVRPALLGEQVPVDYVAVSPAEDLASVTALGSTIVFELHRFEGGHGRQVALLPGSPGLVAVSLDASTVAFTADRRLTVLEARSGNELGSLDCPAPASLGLSSNGGVMVAACGSTAVIYDVRRRTVVRTMEAARGSAVVLSRDGSSAFAGAEVVAASTGRTIQRLNTARAAAFDPRAQRIAMVMGDTVAVHTLGSKAAPRQMDSPRLFAEGVAFRPDGLLLAVGTRDMQVKLFDAASGKLVRNLEHAEPNQTVFRIRTLVYSADGRRIATIADDPTESDRGRPGTLRVFDVQTGVELARVPFPEAAHALRFAADNSYVEAAVGWRRIRWAKYPLLPGELIRQSCELVHANLSAAEWRRYMGTAARRNTCAVTPYAAWPE